MVCVGGVKVVSSARNLLEPRVVRVLGSYSYVVRTNSMGGPRVLSALHVVNSVCMIHKGGSGS